MSSIFKNFFQKSQNNEPGEVEYIGKAPGDSDTVKISAKIIGRVQGVGFRFTTKQTADQLGINGIVRNETDGSVYVEAVGAEEKMNQFIEALSKGPSPSATVDRVVIEYDRNIEERVNFSQSN